MAKSKAWHNGEHSVHPIVAEFDVIQNGMTKREAFAMAAMQGILANQYSPIDDDNDCKEAAVVSVMMGDALLKELAK